MGRGLNRDEILGLLEEHGHPEMNTGGGAAMVLRGLREDTDDIDADASTEVFEYLRSKYGNPEISLSVPGGKRMYTLPGTPVDVHETDPGGEKMEGVPGRVSSPGELLAFYREVDRPKDRKWIRALERVVGGGDKEAQADQKSYAQSAGEDSLKIPKHAPYDNLSTGNITVPGDEPGSGFKWVHELPSGQRLGDRAGYLRDVYGDAAEEEARKARQYAKKNDLPYDATGFLGSEHAVPVETGKPFYYGTTARTDFPAEGTEPDVVQEGWGGINGIPPGRYFSSTSASNIGHEIIGHSQDKSLGDPDKSSLGPRSDQAPNLNKFNRNRLYYKDVDYGITYPEYREMEMVPPGSAIQQHMYRRTGSRLESPEEYDAWVEEASKYSPEKREALPVEVRRWLNYRDRVQRDPKPERRQHRLNYLDRNMRRIIPGLVRNDSNYNSSYKYGSDMNKTNEMENAYAEGFRQKCAQLNVNPTKLVKKFSQVSNPESLGDMLEPYPEETNTVSNSELGTVEPETDSTSELGELIEPMPAETNTVSNSELGTVEPETDSTSELGELIETVPAETGDWNAYSGSNTNEYFGTPGELFSGRVYHHGK